MQYCVTGKRRKKSKNNFKKSIIFIVSFFLIIVLLCFALVASKRSNICFETRSFYVVYVDKNKNKENLLSLQKSVKDLGGAGVFVEKNNEFCLAVNIYKQKDDANKIAKDIKQSFYNCSVLEINQKKVSKKFVNFIKDNVDYFELYKCLYNMFDEYESKCFQFVKGDITEGGFMSSLISDKIEIETLIEKCLINKNDKLQVIVDCGNLSTIYIKNLFDKFYSSTTKESLCYEFFVNLCLSFIELCDKLQ